MTKQNYMRVKKDVLRELKRIKEKGRKNSISDVVEEFIEDFYEKEGK